jgi:hypothetical protein
VVRKFARIVRSFRRYWVRIMSFLRWVNFVGVYLTDWRSARKEVIHSKPLSPPKKCYIKADSSALSFGSFSIERW